MRSQQHLLCERCRRMIEIPRNRYEPCPAATPRRSRLHDFGSADVPVGQSRARKAHSRPPIERMAVIAARLRRGKVVTCSNLAARLEVYPKTVARDINFMRDRLGYEIEWDPRHHSYRLLSAPPPVL